MAKPEIQAVMTRKSAEIRLPECPHMGVAVLLEAKACPKVRDNDKGFPNCTKLSGTSSSRSPSCPPPSPGRPLPSTRSSSRHHSPRGCQAKTFKVRNDHRRLYQDLRLTEKNVRRNLEIHVVPEAEGMPVSCLRKGLPHGRPRECRRAAEDQGLPQGER